MNLHKLHHQWIARMTTAELDRLEQALLIASRSDDIDSETAAFVTEVLDKITEMRG